MLLQSCGKIKSPFQHASMLCSKYKERVRRLSGLGMQILPVVGRYAIKVQINFFLH